MLKRLIILFTLLTSCALGVPIATSAADTWCREEAIRTGEGNWSVEIVCTDDGSTPGSSSGGAPDGCWTWGGKQVECTLQDDTGYYWWSSQRQTYCRLAIPPPEPSHEIWDGHRDANGNPKGAAIWCVAYDVYFIGEARLFWIPTPPVIDTLATQIAKRAVASLELHPPVFHLEGMTRADVADLAPWLPVGAVMI